MNKTGDTLGLMVQRVRSEALGLMADTTPGNLTFQLILGQQSEPVLAEVSGMSKES